MHRVICLIVIPVEFLHRKPHVGIFHIVNNACNLNSGLGGVPCQEPAHRMQRHFSPPGLSRAQSSDGYWVTSLGWRETLQRRHVFDALEWSFNGDGWWFTHPLVFAQPVIKREPK